MPVRLSSLTVIEQQINQRQHNGPMGRRRDRPLWGRSGLAMLAGLVTLTAVGCSSTTPSSPGAAARSSSAGARGGAFLLRFDDDRPQLRLGAWLINQRTRWTRLPLGDQAHFVTRETFARLGGFKEWPILEDLDFAWRLRRTGGMVILDEPVTTAARRFVERGVVKTVATNWLIWALFCLGVSPYRLARLYKQIR